ncbi:MAG: NifB/NifX family molybdenum-iron cluster-binding protein [Thermodesulfobacteriota bacterium]
MAVIPFPVTPPACCGKPAHATRIVLPVAPTVIARTQHASDRKAAAMPVGEAMAWIGNLQKGSTTVKSADINGPGDPLAAIDLTLHTAMAVRQSFPDAAISVTTLGIHGETAAPMLAEAGVGRLVLEVNGIDPETIGRLYAWIRPGKRTLPITQAAALLVEEQQLSVAACRKAGIEVTAKTTLYPGINLDKVGEIAGTVAGWGVNAMIVVPCQTSTGNQSPTDEQLAAARNTVAAVLALGEDTPAEECILPPEKSGVAGLPKPTPERPNVAVVSGSGMEVDLHLGHAIKVLIYGPRADGLACLLETRPAPEPGAGSERWLQLADTLQDCFALLAASAGNNPRQILGEKGITVLVTEGDIEGLVDVLYGGGRKGKGKKRG